jgi:hypothetical protein
MAIRSRRGNREPAFIGETCSAGSIPPILKSITIHSLHGDDALSPVPVSVCRDYPARAYFE